mmetsp:Transcript_88332/g.248801  ORF Transcript_88332/g.248801 Transcript_88332/m.248801 type:complete len:566 (-) Transcript_88332:120-1817(-)
MVRALSPAIVWQQQRPPAQFFAVARHAERADDIGAQLHGFPWGLTEDFKKWPVDPPLSDHGLEAAQQLGERLRSSAEANKTTVHVVVSSPYFRCIQTAVEICHCFGAKLLVDQALGEIFGPSVLGDVEPDDPVRPSEETASLCAAYGITCITMQKVFGTWPAWPETTKDARRRYASRFLVYLRRMALTRRNFVLVSHADCIGAALSIMPSHARKHVERVEYGGAFVAVRRQNRKKPTPSSRSNWSQSSVSVVATWRPHATPSSAQPFGCKRSDPSSFGVNDVEAGGRQTFPTIDSEADTGWHLQTEGMQLRPCSRTSSEGLYDRGINMVAMVESFLTLESEIERRVGKQPKEPLEATEKEPHEPLSPYSGHLSVATSTHLFAASDLGCLDDLSDLGLSPMPRSCSRPYDKEPEDVPPAPRRASAQSNLRHEEASSPTLRAPEQTVPLDSAGAPLRHLPVLLGRTSRPPQVDPACLPSDSFLQKLKTRKAKALAADAVSPALSVRKWPADVASGCPASDGSTAVSAGRVPVDASAWKLSDSPLFKRRLKYATFDGITPVLREHSAS